MISDAIYIFLSFIRIILVWLSIGFAFFAGIWIQRNFTEIPEIIVSLLQ